MVVGGEGRDMNGDAVKDDGDYFRRAVAGRRGSTSFARSARPTCRVLAPALLSLGLSLPAMAQEAVFVIRHAEKEAGDDPTLTEAGRARAEGWVAMLAEAGIDAIFVTDRRRTQETGGIIGEGLGLTPVEVPRGDVTGLLDQLSFDHEEDRVLVVHHEELIPRVLEGLGVGEAVEIGEEEFGAMFVVTGVGMGEVVMVRLGVE